MTRSQPLQLTQLLSKHPKARASRQEKEAWLINQLKRERSERQVTINHKQADRIMAVIEGALYDRSLNAISPPKGPKPGLMQMHSLDRYIETPLNEIRFTDLLIKEGWQKNRAQELANWFITRKAWRHKGLLKYWRYKPIKQFIERLIAKHEALPETRQRQKRKSVIEKNIARIDNIMQKKEDEIARKKFVFSAFYFERATLKQIATELKMSRWGVAMMLRSILKALGRRDVRKIQEIFEESHDA